MQNDSLPSISRRQFLRGAGGLTLAASLPGIACQNLERAVQTPDLQLSLAQWSLHRALQGGELDHLDFPRVARRQFGIGAVEYVNSFFKDKAQQDSYLQVMRSKAEDEGVRSLLIMVDGEGNLGGQDAQRAIENHYKWIDAAAYLGCHSIRVNAGGGGTKAEVARRAADSLHTLAEYGAPMGISVIVENHGGYSSNGAWLAGVMVLADHPGVGTLPDFGNFRISAEETYDRYRGVRELMPFAKAVSAKSHEFDENGQEKHTDFKRMMDIVSASGYRGYVGIEYEGSAHSEFEGIHKTGQLLRSLGVG